MGEKMNKDAFGRDIPTPNVGASAVGNDEQSRSRPSDEREQQRSRNRSRSPSHSYRHQRRSRSPRQKRGVESNVERIRRRSEDRATTRRREEARHHEDHHHDDREDRRLRYDSQPSREKRDERSNERSAEGSRHETREQLSSSSRSRQHRRRRRHDSSSESDSISSSSSSSTSSSSSSSASEDRRRRKHKHHRKERKKDKKRDKKHKKQKKAKREKKEHNDDELMNREDESMKAQRLEEGLTPQINPPPKESSEAPLLAPTAMPPSVPATGTLSTAKTIVKGYATKFKSEVQPKDGILIRKGTPEEEFRIVRFVLSDNSLSISNPFASEMTSPTPFHVVPNPHRQGASHPAHNSSSHPTGANVAVPALSREELLDQRLKSKTDRMC